VAKTGYTDAAQHTFAGVIERNGHHYGVVLMRAQRYPDDQWQQATKLVNWGLHLPQGAPAVGHLDAAVQPAGTKKGPSDPVPSTSSAAAARESTGSSSVMLPALLAVGGLLAIGGGIAWLRTQRR
jgi:D-alanyl-D-alanine carboxypeptidase (penicillin-binding protein 5/6)